MCIHMSVYILLWAKIYSAIDISFCTQTASVVHQIQCLLDTQERQKTVGVLGSIYILMSEAKHT